MQVENVYKKIQSRPLDKADAHALVRAAERDDEAANGCCGAGGTPGSDWLRDKFGRDRNPIIDGLLKKNPK